MEAYPCGKTLDSDTMNQFMSDVALSNKFPGKLWRMVNTCTSGAIGWSPGGHTIIIQQALFQEEYLDPPNCVFKTSNIGSFIRQLNLYGFRKLNALRFTDTMSDMEDSETRGVHEFQNDFFVKGRPDLLSRLRRNVGIRRSREIAVKKRMDIFHALPKKVAESRYFQYIDAAGQDAGSSFQAMCPQLKHEMSQFTSASGSNPGSTDSPEIPVFLQWDGQSYKYVILPDHNLQFSQQTPNMPNLQRIIRQPALPQAQTPSVAQPHVLVSRYGILPTTDIKRNASNLQIIHVPDEDGNESKQYYLVDVGNANQENDDDDDDVYNAKTNQSEYIDMYEVAKSFAPRSSSANETSKASSKVSACTVSDDDSMEARRCNGVTLLDSSPNVLNKDASMPSVCPASVFDLGSPCTSQGTAAGESTMSPYDVIDKSELDVYIRGHDDLLLSATDNDDLTLFPGVNISGANGGGSLDDNMGFDFPEEKPTILSLDPPVIVESIERNIKKPKYMA